MDDLKTFQTAVAAFNHAMASISARWDGKTPDDEWTVRELVNHVVVEDLWVPPLVAGQTVEQVGSKFDGDQLGEDGLKAWIEASGAAVKAFADAVPGTKVALSRGATPVEDYLIEMAADHTIHAWDLAVSVGGDSDLPNELVKRIYEYFEKTAEQWRAGGAFKVKVSVPDDAPLQDKLLALTGRNPNWRPS